MRRLVAAPAPRLARRISTASFSSFPLVPSASFASLAGLEEGDGEDDSVLGLLNMLVAHVSKGKFCCQRIVTIFQISQVGRRVLMCLVDFWIVELLYCQKGVERGGKVYKFDHFKSKRNSILNILYSGKAVVYIKQIPSYLEVKRNDIVTITFFFFFFYSEVLSIHTITSAFRYSPFFLECQRSSFRVT